MIQPTTTTANETCKSSRVGGALLYRPATSSDMERNMSSNASIAAEIVREAGHAMGRCVTAAEMGIAPEQSFSWLECAESEQFIGRTIAAPPFSEDVKTIIRRDRYIQENGLSFAAIKGILTNVETDAEKASIAKWLEAKALQLVYGAAAVSVLTGMPFREAVYGNDGASYLQSFVLCCKLAGLTPPEAESLIDVAYDKVMPIMRQSKTITAIEAIALALIEPGKRMEGGDVVAIIQRVMADSSLTEPVA